MGFCSWTQTQFCLLVLFSAWLQRVWHPVSISLSCGLWSFAARVALVWWLSSRCLQRPFFNDPFEKNDVQFISLFFEKCSKTSSGISLNCRQCPWNLHENVNSTVFPCWLCRQMSFLIKVKCHFLDGNLCLLLWVSSLRAGLFQCDRCPSQALSFPDPVLLPCIIPDGPQVSARVSTGDGMWPCGCKWVGKGRVLIMAQKAQLFSPHPSSPGWSWASLHLMLLCPFSPSLCLGSPITFHKLWKCKNPSDFWSELFVVLKGKMIQGWNIQEDFGVSLLLILVTARPGVGLNTQIYQ